MESRRGFLGRAGCLTATLLAGCLSGGDSSVQPGTSTETDWPRPRADSANTAYVPNAKAPRESVRERWTVAEGSASGTPAIVDGSVYFPTTRALLALDVGSGNEQWRFAPPEATNLSSPIVYDGHLYTTDGESLYALDAETGTPQWSHTDNDHGYAALTVVAGEGVPDPHLVAGTTSGTMLGLGPQTGKRVWRRDMPTTVSAFGFRTFILYAGTRDGGVYAFYWEDTDISPREAWRSTVDNGVETMVPCSDGVTVHTDGGPLRLLQGGPAAGTTRWTIDNEWANSAPIYTNPTFYTVGSEGFTAIQEYKEETKWRIDEPYDAAAPVAAGDTLYLSSGDAVYAFAADGGVGIGTIRTGAKRWSHSTPSAVGGLAVADGALFVACDGTDQTLYCLESA